VLSATETAQQLKKTAGVPFHAKGRGLVKKMDTTSEFDTLLVVAKTKPMSTYTIYTRV
jgi:negative elongation factor A